jgi:hypothetical protein
MNKRGSSVKRPLELALAISALVGACGRRVDVLGVIAGDGGPDAVLPVAPRFAAPSPIAALSDPDAIDEDPTFTADQLELYFMSTRAGTRDLWTSRRGAAEDAWGAPTRVAELSSPASDWAAAVSLDGLRIWFSSDRASAPRGQLWRSSRAARTAAWSAPEPVAELASGSVDFAPAVDAAETLLVFASDRPGATGGSGFDLYASARAASNSAWGSPVGLAGANGAGDEYDPFVAQGGLVLFFTSMRTGAGDLYWTFRRSVTEPFAAPVALVDLNSDGYDSDATLSLDLGYIMFSSTRSGNAEIYEARRRP